MSKVTMSKDHEHETDHACEILVESNNSCEISVNAKGDKAFKVKAYGETLADALEQAQAAADDMVHWVHGRK